MNANTERNRHRDTDVGRQPQAEADEVLRPARLATHSFIVQQQEALLRKWEPLEMFPVWSLCLLAEMSHVADYPVPPPIVPMILHSINPLLNKKACITTEADLDEARHRPSWIRCLYVDSGDEWIIAKSMALEGIRKIQCDLASTVAPLFTSRTLKSLNLDGAPIRNEELAGIERVTPLEVLSLSYCKRITSVSCLSTAASLKILYLNFMLMSSEGLAGIERVTTLEELSLLGCKQINSVTCLSTAASLKNLDLSRTSMTNAGLAGIELVATLEELSLRH